MKAKSPSLIGRSYHARIKELLKGSAEKEIFNNLKQGKNSYLRLERMNSSSFDKSWIEIIEDCIFDMGDIIANPRLTTKQEGNLVPVELARKTDAGSVQHLAVNTQYIKEVDEYGNIIPSKILGITHQDNYITYENRFIATFIRRLVLFIEKRYEIVSKLAELRNEEVLMFKNQSIVNGADVEIETKVKVSYKNEDEATLKSNAYIARIAKIREYILYFYKSPFMRMFKTEKDVRNPIIQTNIIRKQPKYRHCYEVFRFIESYDRLGVNYKVSEKYSDFNEKEMDEITDTLFANYVTLKGKNITGNLKPDTHIYKPKVLTSMDDEIFVYGPLVNTPISFVRVDEYYQQYLESKISKDLPAYPTKQEREYFAEEYEEKRELKEDGLQLEALKKRKIKDNNKFEYNVKLILRQRERARQELEDKQLAAIAAEEQAMLMAARGEIAQTSLEHIQETVVQQPAKEETSIENKYREPNMKKIILPADLFKPSKSKTKPDEEEEQDENEIIKKMRIQHDFDEEDDEFVENEKIPPLKESPFVEQIPVSEDKVKLPRKAKTKQSKSKKTAKAKAKAKKSASKIKAAEAESLLVADSENSTVEPVAKTKRVYKKSKAKATKKTKAKKTASKIKAVEVEPGSIATDTALSAEPVSKIKRTYKKSKKSINKEKLALKKAAAKKVKLAKEKEKAKAKAEKAKEAKKEKAKLAKEKAKAKTPKNKVAKKSISKQATSQKVAQVKADLSSAIVSNDTIAKTESVEFETELDAPKITKTKESATEIKAVEAESLLVADSENSTVEPAIKIKRTYKKSGAKKSKKSKTKKTAKKIKVMEVEPESIAADTAVSSEPVAKTKRVYKKSKAKATKKAKAKKSASKIKTAEVEPDLVTKEGAESAEPVSKIKRTYKKSKESINKEKLALKKAAAKKVKLAKEKEKAKAKAEKAKEAKKEKAKLAKEKAKAKTPKNKVAKKATPKSKKIKGKKIKAKKTASKKGITKKPAVE